MMQDAEKLAADEAPPAQTETRAVVAPVHRTGRKGFLPFRTNTWDRFFISMVSLVAIGLVWMRFVEAYLPLYVALLISIIWGYILITRG